MGCPNTQRLFFFVCLIVFIVVVWKYYWRVQIMCNSDILSLYTPDDIFPSKNTVIMNYHIRRGFEEMKTKTVVICALLRDVESKMDEIEKKVESVGNCFYDYRVLIVENDSSDNTRKRLLKWSARNPRVVVLGCGINVKECSIKSATKKTEGHGVDRKRIAKMTLLRNIYLSYLRAHFPNFDYMVVWDLDIIGSVYLDGIANSISYFNEVGADAICAYGIYRWGLTTLYYDTYAHIDKEDAFHIDLKTIHDLKKGLGTKYQRGEFPVPVVSCFSGFTIYRVKSILSLEYDMTPESEGNLECEHVRLHKKLKNIYLNPSMVNLVLLND